MNLQDTLAHLNGRQVFVNVEKEGIELFFGVKLELVNGKWQLATPPKGPVTVCGGVSSSFIVVGNDNHVS